MKVPIVVVVIVVVVLALVVGLGLSSILGGKSVVQIPMLNRSPYVGSWSNHFGFGNSRLTFNADGTGSGSGYIFGDGTTFTWREDGDHIVVVNQPGVKYDFNYGKVASDGKSINMKGVNGIHENFDKETN